MDIKKVRYEPPPRWNTGAKVECLKNKNKNKKPYSYLGGALSNLSQDDEVYHAERQRVVVRRETWAIPFLTISVGKRALIFTVSLISHLVTTNSMSPPTETT